MSRVEITHNKGPDVITSIDQEVSDCTNNLYSTAVNVRLYTLHSYQVITDKSITVTIIGSNYTDLEKNIIKNLALEEITNFFNDCVDFIFLA